MKIKEQKVMIAGFDLTQGGDCVYRAITSEKTQGLDTMFGTVFVYDRNINSYDSVYPFHIWNIDENDNVYDTGSIIQQHAEEVDFKCKPANEWNIQVVDGFDFDFNGGYQSQAMKVNKILNKRFRGKYDAVYVEGFAFQNDHTTKLDWDKVEEILEGAENHVELVG